MSLDTLLFWLIAIPVGVVCSVLLIRYGRANHRWTTRRADQARYGTADDFVSQTVRRLARRPRGLQYFAFTFLSLLRHGPLVMFREDSDPVTEALRREAVDRYGPLMVIFASGVILWFLIAIPVLIYLGVHALLQ